MLESTRYVFILSRIVNYILTKLYDMVNRMLDTKLLSKGEK
jgi:hypothetical protein